MCIMLILLTNDDGINAPGILAMYSALCALGEVHVVAPETVQSATGHGITIRGPLLTSKVEITKGIFGTAIDGRPADCVKLAVNQLLPRRPDLVVSGINSGVNVGINVIYSGTVAAAIEAGFLGLPAVAVSLLLKPEVIPDYDHAAALTIPIIHDLFARGLTGGDIVSINLPALVAPHQPAGIKFCRQCTQPWVDTYERRKDPRGREYFWNNSVFTLGRTEDDTDVACVRDNYIAVTPLQFDMTEHRLLKKWNTREGSAAEIRGQKSEVRDD